MVTRSIKGEIIAPGIVVGELCFNGFTWDSPRDVVGVSKQEIGVEIKRFESEADALVRELEETVRKLDGNSLVEEAEIIKTHIMMLQDKGFHRSVHERIASDLLAAETALEHVLKEMVETLKKSEDLLFSERAADLSNLLIRLGKKLRKEEETILLDSVRGIEKPVVVTKELFVSLVLEAQELHVLGFIVEQGTVFSHAAIIAKSFGIPVLKVKNVFRSGIENRAGVLLDADRGRFVISPSELEMREIVPTRREEPPATASGPPVKIWINIVDPLQIRSKDLEGLAGIGLYRTEVLFMKWKEDFPSEEEQYQVYASLFAKCPNLPVTVRTLDIGGDKTLPYFSLGPQDNPYLGLRAHRIYRYHPEILITQIRALLRAAFPGGTLRILYPMIEGLEELLFVQDLLQRSVDSLRDEGREYQNRFQQGLMLEVPSAVWDLARMFPRIDFISLGTNDLLQYFFAMDRNNANVSRLFPSESPVVLRLLRSIVDQARAAGKSLNICGEVASDVRFLPFLIGLGFEQLSIDLNAVEKVRNLLARLETPFCRELVDKCLLAETAPEVRKIMEAFYRSWGLEIESPAILAEPEVIDPICKMSVHTQGNKFRVVRQDETYYFCSQQCLDKFIKMEG